MKKIKIVSLVLAVALLAGVTGCKKNKDSDSDKNKQNVDIYAEEEVQEEKVYIPTFMYFVSNDDADFDKTNEVIEKLKNEYDGKVNFDIRNVTEDPSSLENFPVEGQTPALIMLDTSNNISNFLFMNGIYDDLKAAIDAALKQ